MNITNNTPWNTEDLTKFITETFSGLAITDVHIDLMASRSNRWRKHVRPSHVYDGTQRQNMKDAITRGRRKPHGHQGAKDPEGL